MWPSAQPYLDLFFALSKGRAWDGGGFAPPRPRGLCAVKIADLARHFGMNDSPTDAEEVVSLVQACDDTWQAWYHARVADADAARTATTTVAGKALDPNGAQPLAVQWQRSGLAPDVVSQLSQAAGPTPAAPADVTHVALLDVHDSP